MRQQCPLVTVLDALHVQDDAAVDARRPCSLLQRSEMIFVFENPGDVVSAADDPTGGSLAVENRCRVAKARIDREWIGWPATHQAGELLCKT